MAGPLPPPKERLILHFTHIKHLAGIIDEGWIYCDALVGSRLTAEVGDRGIKYGRRQLKVTCGPGGHPCDYVPFYFAPKSPMLYRIARGGVEQYQDGQDPLVYLVSRIGDVVDTELRWVFSDGNGGAGLTGYYDDLEQLDSAVDWPLQRATMWSATADDPTRPTRRAAEFLVHERMPWSLIGALVVRCAATERDVKSILSARGSAVPVYVKRDWYYNGAKYK